MDFAEKVLAGVVVTFVISFLGCMHYATTPHEVTEEQYKECMETVQDYSCLI